MSSKRLNLTGERYGKLTVIKYIGYKNKKSIWECQCDCGNIVNKSVGELRGGGTISCGCWRKERVKANLIGKKFGRLTVVEEVGRNKWGGVIWRCQCDCGNITETLSKYLLNGDTTSCGCRRMEILKETTELETTHHMTNTRLYRIWSSMKRRCYNLNDKNYKNYGERGITICEEWNEFINFYNWAIKNNYDDNLTIDRIDVNKNYEPNNCRWVDRKIQGNNTRRNHYITYNGETKTMSEWADLYGINYNTLRGRINNYNWSIEKAFNTPVRKFETHSNLIKYE